MALVDDAQRVVRAREARVLGDCRACPPIGIVQLTVDERLDRAVVQVHGDDRLLVDHPRVQAPEFPRQQEIDRQVGLVLANQEIGRIVQPGYMRAQRHVDVTDEEVDVAAAPPGFVQECALVGDRQSHLLGEGRRHDDQRQAVPGTRRERLRGVAGLGGVVFELELALAVQRFEQALLSALGLGDRSDRGAQVLLHLGAHREQVVRADALGRGPEPLVVEKALDAWRQRGRRAGGKQQRKQQDSPGFHLASPFPAGSKASTVPSADCIPKGGVKFRRRRMRRPVAASSH